MSGDRQLALQYLRGPAQKLWYWADNGAVILWHDGTTVAFREEIQEILARFETRGLPALGAIVLLLAACRGKKPTVNEIFGATDTEPGADGPGSGKPPELRAARKHVAERIQAWIDQLEKIGSLPEEIRSGLKARAALAEIVFEPLKEGIRTPAIVVLHGMKGHFEDGELVESDPKGAASDHVQHLCWVGEGIKNHDPKSLTLRLRTGLNALPEDPKVMIPPAARVRELLEAWESEKGLGMVCLAARELMAAIRIPRELGPQDPLSLGGVADITNRGPLDRLLMSELAQDDLTLAVRIALNEALYLKREPPRREPTARLTFLLDSSLRLWGLPRVIATSVALAVIAADRDTTEVKSWRSRGGQLVPVNLFSQEGLIEHLEALETDLDPSQALAAFDKLLEEDGDDQNQTIIITHRDTLDDPEFRQRLNTVGKRIRFAATIDHKGCFALYTLPRVSRQPIAEAELDLKRLLALDQKVQGGTSPLPREYPVILDLHPLPFLLPVAGRVERWCVGPGGYWHANMNDRRLIQMRGKGKGARVLCPRLPAGVTLWLGEVNEQIYAVKAPTTHRQAKLVSVSLTGTAMHEVDLDMEPTMRVWKIVFETGGVLVAIGDREVRAFSLQDGRLLDRVKHEAHPMNGRFLARGGKCFCVLWNGLRLQLQEVHYPEGCTSADILLTFDRSGMEGPWVLTRSGHVISTLTQEKFEIGHPAVIPVDERTRISQCGHVVILAPPPPNPNRPRDNRNFLFHLREKKSWMAPIPPGPYHDGIPQLPTWNVLRWVERIAFVDSAVALGIRKNRWRRFHLGSSKTIQWMKEGESPMEGEMLVHSFKPFESDPAWGCTLQMAQLNASTRVFLDTRGLLHFKSSHARLPEVSIVLGDQELSGWSSHGAMCGPAFFIDGNHNQDPVRVYSDLTSLLRYTP